MEHAPKYWKQRNCILLFYCKINYVTATRIVKYAGERIHLLFPHNKACEGKLLQSKHDFIASNVRTVRPISKYYTVFLKTAQSLYITNTTTKTIAQWLLL